MTEEPSAAAAAPTPGLPAFAPGQPVYGWYIPAGPVPPTGYGPPMGVPMRTGGPPPAGMPPPPNWYPPPPGWHGQPPGPYGPPPGPYGQPPGPYGQPPGPYGPPLWLGPMRPPSFARVPRTAPEPYLRLMRTVNYRWWRPILGLLAFIGSYLVAAVIVTLAFVATRVNVDLTRLDDLTDPATLALTNASLIVAIPAVWVAWVAHTERIGWSSSVLGRIRWRLLWRYGVLAMGLLIVGILLSLLVGGGIGPSTGFDGREFTLLAVVVVVSTPFQAAAEEFFFRGYLSQVIGTWIPARIAGAVLAALITATLFSLAHAPGDFLTFLDRFAFGLAASAVVLLTGGLEAAIAFHAANNVVIFLVVGALGGQTSSDIQSGDGTAVLVVGLDILVMGLFVWIVSATRSRWHPELRSRAIEPDHPQAGAPAPAAPWSQPGAGWPGWPPVG